MQTLPRPIGVVALTEAGLQSFVSGGA